MDALLATNVKEEWTLANDALLGVKIFGEESILEKLLVLAFCLRFIR